MLNKDFWKCFLSALGTLASLATLITFLFEWRASQINPIILIILAIFILAVCWMYGWWVTRRKNKIEIKFNASFKLAITFGDLFNPLYNGIFVIPVNQFFDTQVSSSIVSRDSVLGTFISKSWQDRVDELDTKIEKELNGIPGTLDKNRKVGKNIKYDLGTCIKILDGGNVYVLVVTTEKKDKTQSILSKKDYPLVIGKLFEYLDSMSKNHIIYMPLLGAGRGRMTRPRQRIISFLIDTIDFKYSDRSFPLGVNVIIKNKYEREVNLNTIENHFEHALKD